MTRDDVFNRIMVTIPGVVRDVLELEMLATVREFCTKAGVWRGTVTPTDPMVLPAGREVALVDQVHLDGYSLSPLPDHGTPVDPPSYTYVYDQESNSILSADGMPDDLTAEVWYRPLALPNVPAHVWANWDEAIVQGTLARLYLHAAKPYTNPAMAALSHRKFTGQVALARRRAKSSNSRADVGWSFPLGVRGRPLRR